MSVVEMGQWLNPKQAMDMMGCSRYVLNKLCRDRMLKCKKVGRTWYVHRSEFE